MSESEFVNAAKIELNAVRCFYFINIKNEISEH